jgi:hypothetical protein
MEAAPGHLQLPEELRDLVLDARKKCVAFIGSGPSSGSYYSWPDLINRLCERCGSPSRVKRDSPADALLDAAQDAKEANEQSYYSFLGEHFGRRIGQGSFLYSTLFSLPFHSYLTVNLDPLLARQSRTASIRCNPQIYAYPHLDRVNVTERSIHYLHGIIREGTTPAEGTVVLARSEFEEAYEDSGTCMNFLVQTFENNPVVFLGCRLDEPVMAKVFSICKKHQLKRQKAAHGMGQQIGSLPPRFIILPEPEIWDSQARPDEHASVEEKDKRQAYYRDMDITTIWYRASDGDHVQLQDALDRLAGLSDISPKYGWKGGDDVI